MTRPLSKLALPLQREHPHRVPCPLSNQPVVHKRRLLRRATRLLRSQSGPRSPEHTRSAALQYSNPADPRSPEHTRSATRLLRNPADPRSLEHTRSATPIHSAVEERLPQGNARSKATTGSAPAAAVAMPRVRQLAAAVAMPRVRQPAAAVDILRVRQPAADVPVQDARRIEGRRDIPAERARRHPRRGHQNDVFTPSKRSQPARSPYRRRS